MSDQVSVSDYPVFKAPEDDAPAHAYTPTDPPADDDFDDLDGDFAPRPRQRLGKLTVLLVALVLIGAGVLGGIELNKHQGSSSTATGRGRRSATRPPGARPVGRAAAKASPAVPAAFAGGRGGRNRDRHRHRDGTGTGTGTGTDRRPPRSPSERWSASTRPPSCSRTSAARTVTVTLTATTTDHQGDRRPGARRRADRLGLRHDRGRNQHHDPLVERLP